MPASPYLMEQSNLNGGPASTSTIPGMAPAQTLTSPTEQLALQLALLQGGLHSEFEGGNGVNGHNGQSCMMQGGFRGSLEDLKMPMPQRKSQNMTECVPVPTSEHVAEIVGRQGCKIKALRAKTNTYIKTPVRGEEPVFVVTGRKEDVALAKREILSAADHFSQIRASRKGNINSTLAFGQLVANQPGQTTQQVRVPYRVVGLVVGPKGATIKRIQQQTRTYIVTPSRDKEPIFEVTGLPENVEVARKEIEAHIAFRTGSGEAPPGSSDSGSTSGFYGNLNDVNGDDSVFSSPSGMFGSVGSFERGSSSTFDHMSSNRQQTEANGGSSLFGGERPSMMGGSGFNNRMNDGGHQNKGITLQNILDSNNFDLIANGMRSGATNVQTNGLFSESSTSNGWGDSQDSGISGSPPFDKQRHGMDHPSGSGIWGELDGALGGMKIQEPERSIVEQQSQNGNQQQLVTRASVDLGTLGRPQAVPLTSSNSLTLIGALTTAAGDSENTANSISSSVMVPTAGSGPGNNYHHQPVVATSSTGSSSVASLSDMSPPNSLPHYLSSENRSSLNLGGNFLEDKSQTATEENNLKKLIMIQNAELLRNNELNEKKSTFD